MNLPNIIELQNKATELNNPIFFIGMTSKFIENVLYMIKIDI